MVDLFFLFLLMFLVGLLFVLIYFIGQSVRDPVCGKFARKSMLLGFAFAFIIQLIQLTLATLTGH